MSNNLAEVKGKIVNADSTQQKCFLGYSVGFNWDPHLTYIYLGKLSNLLRPRADESFHSEIVLKYVQKVEHITSSNNRSQGNPFDTTPSFITCTHWGCLLGNKTRVPISERRRVKVCEAFE